MIKTDKIAFLCHPYHRGGATRWMADAAIRMSERGIHVYFVTVAPSVVFYSGRTAETMVQLLSKNANKVQVVSVAAGREFEFGTHEYCSYVYKKLLTDHVPSGTPIILSDDSMVWAAAAALHDAYPLVGVLHSDEEHYYAMAERYKNVVDIFPCVSERVSKTVKNRTPAIASDRITTIPCGIELPSVNDRVHTSDLLKLVYVGRLTEYQKRISDLARIAKALVSRNMVFHLTIIGDGGADKMALQDKISEDGLEQYVTFTGWLSKEKVQEQLYEADVMILPSDFEGTPISMMEALASGCGFVGTRVSGIEDYETHPLAGDCFRAYDTGDIDAAADKIKQLAEVPLQARQVSARKIADAFFSMDTCIDKYLAAMSVIELREYKKPVVSLPLSAKIKSKLISSLRAIKMKQSVGKDQ